MNVNSGEQMMEVKIDRRGLSYALFGAAVVAATACGQTPRGFANTSDAGTAGGDGSVLGILNPDAAPACGQGCSADLRSIVDCNGNVHTTCPPDQGCAGLKCVPACDSAKASQSTLGCEFYSMVPDTIANTATQGTDGNMRGACFAAFIANTWDTPVSITVDRDGTTLDPAGFARIPKGSGGAITYEPLTGGQLPAGEVAILFLNDAWTVASPDVGCPSGVTAAVKGTDAATHGTGRGSAFHISTSAPVSAYDIYPYGGGKSAVTGATLLLPTSAWDTNYVATSTFTFVENNPFQPFVAVLAAEDATKVTISPMVDIEGGPGVDPAVHRQPHDYVLAKGQYVQFTQDGDLSGSAILADKPVAVWGGMTCMNVPTGLPFCDASHQQIPPVPALGHEYVAARYRNRIADNDESPPWRLVGVVDGTTLTYDPGPPNDAPSTLARGDVIEFDYGQPFVVRSQDDLHPFYFAGHMTGCGALPGNDCRGDPETVNAVPSDQFLQSYVFFTDPTYPETNLVMVRRKGPNGFKDVTLDCLGNVGGWAAVDSSDTLELARVDLVTGNFGKVGNCDNGRHTAKSDALFGLTVWGWGSAATGGTFGTNGPGFYSQAVSYAYPAGAGARHLNSVVVIPH